MVEAVLKVLNVKKAEQKPVLLLLGNGFFLGIFLASTKVIAETLFLQRQSEYLREAIFISGILGLITTAMFANLQRKVAYSRLLSFNYILIFLFVGALRGLFAYYDADWVIFLLYVMIGPMTSVLLLGFWGLFGRLFDLRQSKRIIGGIDSGQLLATIITSFSIPFFLSLVPDITDLLIFGEVGLICSFVFLVILFSNYDLNKYNIHQLSNKRNKKKENFLDMFKNKYVRLLSLFLFFSMMAFMFVEYSFLNVSEQQYQDEERLLFFLSIINGSVLVIGLLIQTFVNDKLISMYGLRITLLVLPLTLALITIMALAAGSTLGYTVSSSTFIWFFLFISISKLFTSSLREAMENPIFKLFFMPLEATERFDIQIKVEGMVNELSRLVAGLLIFLLGLLPFFKLIHYSVALLFIIAGWVYLVYLMYTNYRKKVKVKLERQKLNSGKRQSKGREKLFQLISNAVLRHDPSLMVFCLKIMSKASPKEYAKMMYILRSDKNENVKIALARLQDENYLNFKILNRISKDFQKDVSKLQDSSEEITDAVLEKYLRSENTEERRKLAEYLVRNQHPESDRYITDLLNDTDTIVVSTAINSIGAQKRHELIPFLLEALSSRTYNDEAIDALVAFNQDVLPYLETHFYNITDDETARMSIILIYGKIGGEKVKELLWSKIDFPDLNIISRVYLSLSQIGFKASEDQIRVIKTSLESDISKILWTIKSIRVLKDAQLKGGSRLIEALSEENQYHYDHLYMLLSMVFDPQSIELVKENIESKTNEGVSYALELLDVFLPEDIKLKIIPILDDITDEEKFNRLQIYFPQLDFSIEDIIRQAINREYSMVNRWTKTCAIHLIGIRKMEGFDLELIANLFNKDQLIAETSAWSILQLDESMLYKNLNRVEDSMQKVIEEVIINYDRANSKSGNVSLLPMFDRVEFVMHKSIFKNISGLHLTTFVSFMEETVLEAGTEINLEHFLQNDFYMVYAGQLQVINAKGEILDVFKNGNFVGESIFVDYSTLKIVASSRSLLLGFEKNKFYEFASMDFSIAIQLIESFERSIRNKKKRIASISM